MPACHIMHGSVLDYICSCQPVLPACHASLSHHAWLSPQFVLQLPRLSLCCWARVAVDDHDHSCKPLIFKTNPGVCIRSVGGHSRPDGNHFRVRTWLLQDREPYEAVSLQEQRQYQDAKEQHDKLQTTYLRLRSDIEQSGVHEIS